MDQTLLDLVFVEDIIKKEPDITDIHTIGTSVAIQTTSFMKLLDYEIPDTLGTKLMKERGIDFSATIGGRRIRAHVSRVGNGNCDLSIRVHPQRIRTIEECDAEPEILDLPTKRAGLIVVAGHTGSRKTTLVSAIIDKINETRDAVIITVEDPVELIHTPKKSVIRHKEIGEGLTWNDALRDLYRENADVILIGETRDYDAINAALDLALSGKLVITTIHASSVEDTIRQFVGRAPADKIEIVANNLADCVSAVVVQRMTLNRVFQREFMVFQRADQQFVRDPKRFKDLGVELKNRARQKQYGYKSFPEN